MLWQQITKLEPPDFSGGVTRTRLYSMLQERGWTADEAKEMFDLLSRRKEKVDRTLTDKVGQSSSGYGNGERVKVLDKAFLLTFNEIGFAKTFADLDDNSSDGKLDLTELAKG